MWVCNNCGNTKCFRGYQNYTEWDSERITVQSDGEITDWHDRNSNNSEITDTTIETCANCDLGEISDLEESELEHWKKIHFDANGDFIKDAIKPPISKTKMQILTDELLDDKISIAEYRQRKTQILEIGINGE